GRLVSKAPTLIQPGHKTTSKPLDFILVKAGSDLYQQLRDIRSLPQFRVVLDDLLEAFASNHFSATAASLKSLISACDACSQTGTREPRNEALTGALEGFSRLEVAARSELPAETLKSAKQIFDACKNVNRSLSRVLDLLPEVRLSPISGSEISIDQAVPITA